MYRSLPDSKTINPVANPSHMLVDTPQIVWHGGEAGKNAPVLSVDAHPLTLILPNNDPHGRLPGPQFILATAGTDGEVRLWIVSHPTEEDHRSWDQPEVSGRLQSFVASLEGHQRGVNVVRFSPDGLSVASASDGGTVVVWSVDDPTSWSKLKSDRETHKLVLRGANEDIYDLAWSPDSKYIACGSIDRRTHVWEVATKRSITTLEDHANYVQGTAWDPLCKYLATQSSDRSCRVYQLSHQSDKDRSNGRAELRRLTMRCLNSIKSCVMAVNERGPEPSAFGEVSQVPPCSQVAVAGRTLGVDVERGDVSIATIPIRTETEGIMKGESLFVPSRGAEYAGDSTVLGVNGNVDGDSSGNGTGVTKGKVKSTQRKNLFVDETVTSFFRRLTWSPDGAFLIAPTAQSWDTVTGKTQYCTYLFRREQFDRPAVCLPGLSKPSVAVRCNPRLFAIKGGTAEDTTNASRALCDLPYRVVFAVVSLDAVVVYDTEHSHPLTVATGLHYAGLTDACWSPDGLSLFVSSSDGYVTKIYFADGELGAFIPESEVPSQSKRRHPTIHLDELSGRKTTGSPTVEDADERGSGDAPVQSACEEDNGTSLAAAQPTAQGLNVTFRPKKKIAPTLVKTLPNAGEAGVDAFDATKQPPTTATGNKTFDWAPSSPSRSTGDQSEKRRRITPTLVCSDLMSCNMQVVQDEDEVAGTGEGVSKLSFSTGARNNAQPERNPRKKRLTPTLVSSLQ